MRNELTQVVPPWACICGPPWRAADMHHEDCPRTAWRRRSRYWRRQTGFSGFVVEWTMWCSIVAVTVVVLGLALGWKP